MDFNPGDYMERMKARSLVESQYEWRKWTQEIPSLNFPSDWNIKIIPPFGGAVARFVVTKGNARVSVYLDCYGELGAMDEPYWELYPDAEGDNARVWINETDELIELISESIQQQLEGSTDNNE